MFAAIEFLRQQDHQRTVLPPLLTADRGSGPLAQKQLRVRCRQQPFGHALRSDRTCGGRGGRAGGVEEQTRGLSVALKQPADCRFLMPLLGDLEVGEPVCECQTKHPATALGLADEEPAEGVYRLHQVRRQRLPANVVGTVFVAPVADRSIRPVELAHGEQVIDLQ